MQKYVGTYRAKDGVIRQITFSEGSLYAQRNDGQQWQIFPETSHRFFYAFNTDVSLEFLEDTNGAVTHARTMQNDQWITFIREE